MLRETNIGRVHLEPIASECFLYDRRVGFPEETRGDPVGNHEDMVRIEMRCVGEKILFRGFGDAVDPVSGTEFTELPDEKAS